MEENLPKSFQIEELNRLNGFFILYAVPWALIGLVNIEVKSRQLTGFLFAFAFIVNLLLVVYFSNQIMKYMDDEELPLPTAILMKDTIDSLNRIYIILGIVTAVLLGVFIFLVKQPVLLTPLLLVITGVLFMVHKWYYQIDGERWVGPTFIVLALILIILGNQFINWYSWGGFSAATIIWYVCLDRHLKVHLWLQSIAVPEQTTEEDPLPMPETTEQNQ
ncbi:MAG: hypothetical protein JEZ00_12605 [Anaerolineaceae bacterium]|nr:hypothetical protein [Anaerolineaceae bacterium]